MLKFLGLSKSLHNRIPVHTRERLRALAADAIDAAGVRTVLPTPIVTVQQEVGLRHRLDIRRVPEHILRDFSPPGKDVLGLLVYDWATVFVDTTLPAARLLFTDAHETGHWLCDWHRSAALKFDTTREFYGPAAVEMEAEANFLGAELMFQGDVFLDAMQQVPAGIDGGLWLSERFGASRHATLLHLARVSPAALALAVAAPQPNADGTYRLWQTVESPSFLRSFGALDNLLPAGRLRLQGGALGDQLWHARARPHHPQTRRVDIPDGTATGQSFFCEALYTGYATLILFTEAAALTAPVGMSRVA